MEADKVTVVVRDNLETPVNLVSPELLDSPEILANLAMEVVTVTELEMEMAKVMVKETAKDNQELLVNPEILVNLAVAAETATAQMEATADKAATDQAADAAAEAAKARLAMEQLSVGFTLEGHPTAEYNGAYHKVSEDKGWPVLTNAAGMFCYHHEKDRRWILTGEHVDP